MLFCSSWFCLSSLPSWLSFSSFFLTKIHKTGTVANWIVAWPKDLQLHRTWRFAGRWVTGRAGTCSRRWVLKGGFYVSPTQIKAMLLFQEGIIKLVNRPNRKDKYDKWHLKHPQTNFFLIISAAKWLELLFFAFFCFFSSFSFFFCALWPNSTAKKTGSKSSNNIWREKLIKVEKSRISNKKTHKKK